MNRIEQHISGWAGGLRLKAVEFETCEELLAIDWVRTFTVSRPSFHRFSQAGGKLMAEYMQGRMWYVVGYLESVVAGVPEWRAEHVVQD